jgi:hypothetical protein
MKSTKSFEICNTTIAKTLKQYERMNGAENERVPHSARGGGVQRVQ